MKANMYDPGCPSRQILNRIGDTWSVLIIMSLADGPRRFGELAAKIGGVTPKMLTQTLRGLERDGMISRTVFPEIPPHVEYALTDLGRSLLGLVGALEAWADGHIDDVARARDEYDASRGSCGMPNPENRGASSRAGMIL
jgi:DNA-binding HxlR family transcriptional regulator